jgi:hypothetical protein
MLNVLWEEGAQQLVLCGGQRLDEETRIDGLEKETPTPPYRTSSDAEGGGECVKHREKGEKRESAHEMERERECVCVCMGV